MSAPDAAPSEAARSLIRTLHVDAVTAEVVAALREAGIRSILLKGPALARWLYDDGARRPYSDCDLLVQQPAFTAAERVLAGLGYRRTGLDTIPGDWTRHAVTWIRPPEGTVDLHHTFTGVDGDDDTFWSAVSEGSEWIHLCGVDVEIPSRAARAMIVALHAAKEGSRDAKVRHDLGHALERVPTSLWRDAAALAERVKGTEAFAAGLRSSPAGARLATELGLPTMMSAMVALRAGEGPPPLAAGLDWLFQSRGAKKKIMVVARKVVPPQAYLREWKPLARRGVIGLALAYVWRPFWLAWHAVPAVRALLHALRESRRAA